MCTPCDLTCDTLKFSKPGTCPKCGMELLHKDAIINEDDLVLNEITLKSGSGVFLIEGGQTRTDKHIKVYYHKPKSFSTDSKVLLVIPGAGRNADSYRDTWIDASEKHSVLLLSPQYLEEDYPFGDYHLGGLVKNLNLEGNIEFVENTNIAKLNEEKLTFTFNDNKVNWIFHDFDRIFDLIKAELGLLTNTYDLFGHSAGGHILHRMALFYDNSKANNMLASNASFYTLPDFEYTYPFGVRNTSLEEAALKRVFSKKLVVFLGEEDNATETRGTFLRSKTADVQGLHRLARGTYFFDTAKAKALELGLDFNWKLVVVTNVGHDQNKMGQAASELLYE